MSIENHPTNPYVGPRPFERTEQDCARFFGRTQETREIISLIFSHPILLVYAQSGAGKTSLFNASVVPTLENEGFDVLPLTRVRGSIPKDVNRAEIENLYIFNALLNIKDEVSPATLASETLVSFLSTYPRTKNTSGEPAPRVIIFDQFEELFAFTPGRWREQRDGFFTQVVEALEADPLLRVVFVIREDFLAQLDPYARRLPERFRIRYRLERLQEDAALRAIKEPLTNTFRSFAPGVAEILVRELLRTKTVDVDGNLTKVIGQYVEPVQLQVVCLTLWSDLRQEVTEITEEHLKGFDVDIALSDFYDAAMKSVSEETGIEEAKLRRWFEKYLITPMQTRNNIYRDKGSTGGIPNSVVDILVNHHLILAENRGGVWWYELTHDRFIEAILASNKDWFARRRGANPLTSAAQDWELFGRQDGDLLRGVRFEDANKWAQAHSEELNDLEREFLKACQARYQQRLEAKARSERKLRILTIGLTLGFLIAAVTGLSALWQRNTARLNAAEARSRELAHQSVSNLKNSPQLSLLLAIEALDVLYTADADDALRQAIDASQARTILKQQSRVNAIAFSPTGNVLATGDANGVLNVWDITSGARLDKLGTYHKGSVIEIAFSPDGKKIMTAGADGKVLLWEADSIQFDYYTPKPLGEWNYDINNVAFSSDGKFIVTAATDGTVFVWEVESITNIATLKGHTAPVNAMSMSPARDRVATASLDGTTRLWDLETGKELANLEGHTSGINAVIFSPDGKLLATVSGDGTTRLWQATNGRSMAVLLGHSDSITSAAFSPHGDLLATVSADTTARLWDIKNAIRTHGDGEEGRILDGHKDRINAVAFSPNGKSLATGSADGTAIVWKVPSGEVESVLRLHSSSVNIVRFSPDGKLLATGSSDDTSILWDMTSGEAQKNLRSHNGTIWEAKFSPAGDILASKGEDGLILWDLPTDVHTGKIIVGPVLSDFGGQGFSLDFSANGKLLATSNVQDGRQMSEVSLLDLSASPNERIIATQTINNGIVFDTAFQPHGSLLAINIMDGKYDHSIIRLWHIPGELQEQIAVPSYILYGITFSPNGTLLAASGGNIATGMGVIKLWNTSSLETGSKAVEVATIRTKQTLVRTAFSPNGRILAGSGFDGTIQLWDVQNVISTGGSGAAIATLSGHKNMILGLSFSQDGNLLASSDQDGIVRLWSVPAAVETGGRDAERSILPGQEGGVYSVAFSPDGQWLVTAGEDKILHLSMININDLLVLACQRAVRNLAQVEWDTYIRGEKEYRKICSDLPYHPTVLDGMIEQGRNYVLQEKIEEARGLFNKVNALEPARNLQPDKLLAEMLVELGRQYAYEGDPVHAMEIFRQAIEMDPSTNLDPDQELARILLEVGRQYALEEDFNRALESFREAADLDPSSKIEPDKELAKLLIDQGRQYASEGDVDRARAMLKKANELNPSLGLDLDIEIAKARAIGYVKLAQSYTDSGDYSKALDFLRQAVELDPEVEVREAYEMASLYNSICWYGSIDGFVAIVLPICERAVELADMSTHRFIGGIRDSRGLARALTGNYAGAIEDFTYYVEWGKNANEAESSISLREGWIALLKAGRDPFKEEPSLLQSIR